MQVYLLRDILNKEQSDFVTDCALITVGTRKTEGLKNENPDWILLPALSPNRLMTKSYCCKISHQ